MFEKIDSFVSCREIFVLCEIPVKFSRRHNGGNDTKGKSTRDNGGSVINTDRVKNDK